LEEESPRITVCTAWDLLGTPEPAAGMEAGRLQEGLPVCDSGHRVCGSHDSFPFVLHGGFLVSLSLGEGEVPGIWSKVGRGGRRPRWDLALSLCSCCMQSLRCECEMFSK
jgi:hypothetical protein